MVEAIQEWAGKEWQARLISVKFGKVEDGPGGLPVVPCDVVLEVSSRTDCEVNIFDPFQLHVQGNTTAEPALKLGQWPNLRVTALQKAGETRRYWIPAGPPSTIEASFQVGVRPGVELRQGEETDAEVFQRERCGFWINFNGRIWILSHDNQVNEIVPGIG